MDFTPSPKVQDLQSRLTAFMAEHVTPAEPVWREHEARHAHPTAMIEGLKAKARAQGLWNLFLPGLRDDEPGTRLSNLDYAPLAEIMGRVYWSSEVFNCNAPDTGNIEILHLFATPAQRKAWLEPLLDGRIRSGVSITEPAVASSDPTNLRTTIRRDGGSYVINGRKWFTTNALHPHFAFTIVFGVSDEHAETPRHKRHSFVIVPKDTPGFRIVRDVAIMNHHSVEGHCEIEFKDVRVPAENLLGGEGDGFAILQARMGPGRIHHCMRTIGQCEVALEAMAARAQTRSTFGSRIADYGNVRDWIALSRIEIEQARLLCFKAAWLMDRDGNKAARNEIAMIKVVAGRLQTSVTDRAMQVFGAAGLTPDTPLAYLWTWGRALRFIDGPDEVHLRAIARSELKKTVLKE